MKIDGKEIASEILEDLKDKVTVLKTKGITPHLYVLLLTDDVSTKSYVNQKSLKSEQIGTKITVEIVDPNITTEQLLQKIEALNREVSVHGIIVQRPVPSHIEEEKISEAINIEKDVDGFHPNSKFGIPVALAVLEILKIIHGLLHLSVGFEIWLNTRNISVIGNGLTAGKPIIQTFMGIGITPNIITSITQNKKELLQGSDIIISAVGKPHIFNSSMVKKNAILIGVGMHKEEDNKFHGDFDETEIQNIASFYTPTPGGVGPVNVAMLLKNVVAAASSL